MIRYVLLFALFFSASMLQAQYSGGYNDGYSSVSLGYSVIGGTYNAMYAGGIDDGYARSATLSLRLGSGISYGIFSGGLDDGYTRAMGINTTRVAETGSSPSHIEIHVFPNPTSGEFKILVPAVYSGSQIVRIFDLFGGKVYEHCGFTFMPGFHRIPPRAILPGTYWIQVTAGEYIGTTKVVVY